MELWSPEHIKTLIPSVLIMLVISAILRLTIGKKSRAVRMIPFQILAVFLVLIEFGKQAVSLSKGYDLYHLPFHFCSLFIFMLPIMAFYKGKHSDVIFRITTAICASVTILMMIYPALIYGAGNINEFFEDYMSFHTVTFHNIVVMEFLLILFLDLNEWQKKESLKPVLIFIFAYNVIAAIMAHLLKTNFNNLYTCNIPPLESVRQSVETALGRVPAQILYVIIVIILDLLFVSMSFGIYKLCALALHGKKSKEVPCSNFLTR